MGVDRVIATSATAGAIVCAVNNIKRSQRHLCRSPRRDVAPVGSLLGTLVERDLDGRANVTGVGRRRAEIIIAGVAALDGIMSGLRLPHLQYSTAGVRDGIVADLAYGGPGEETRRNLAECGSELASGF